MKALSYDGYSKSVPNFKKSSLLHDPGPSYLWTTVLFNILGPRQKKNQPLNTKYKHNPESRFLYV